MCGNSFETSEIVSYHLSQILGVAKTLNNIITHYRWPTDYFVLHCEHLFVSQHSTLLSYSSSVHWILTVNHD
jgi:hypothetical protein